MKQKAPAKNPEDEYIEAAILHRQLIEAGDRKGSNSAHDRLIRAIKAIRKSSDKGRFFLSGLLKHNDENVRLWGASHLLPLEEENALAELRRLSRNATSWIVRSSAEVTEAEWRKGTLDIDWFMKE